MNVNWSDYANLSIDVDTLDCYRDVHGIPKAAEGPDPIYAHALPRFLELCERYDVKATLFVIGRDLEQPEHREVVAQAARAGHEIASHSYSHDYGLSRMSRADIDADIQAASRLIREVTGEAPKGFRAPGYNLSEALVDAVEAHGFVYDSSLFPTPVYFAARAMALLRYRLTGRESQSLVGEPREFMGPRFPYIPAVGSRWRSPRTGEGARRLVEIPMGVCTKARLPWLGTSIALFPGPVGRAMTRGVIASKKPAVLELHAMEFAGVDDGIEPELAARQPDLGVALNERLKRLGGTMSALAHHRDVRRLDELAALAH